jgi:hypothetical protein
VNRYETILTQIVAAAIASGRWNACEAARNAGLRDAAAALEAHFENLDNQREAARRAAHPGSLSPCVSSSDDLPAFLKRQAE